MLRIVFSAVALAGVLATAQPAFVDLLAPAAAHNVRAAAPATEQTAPAAAVLSSSPTVTAPASDQSRKQSPVGFGWG